MTYYTILPTCTRYNNLPYGKPCLYLGKATEARNGQILLLVGRTDLSFYEEEIEKIEEEGEDI